MAKKSNKSPQSLVPPPIKLQGQAKGFGDPKMPVGSYWPKKGYGGEKGLMDC